MREIKEKCHFHENAVKECSSIIAEKDSTINELKKFVNEKEKTNSDINNGIDSNDKIRFSDFSNLFTASQLLNLRDIVSTKRGDSTFIATTIRMLYDGKLDCLQTKSVSGRSTKGKLKEKITPDKMDIIQRIYCERINVVSKDNTEKEARKKQMNKLIKDALVNISRNSELKTSENNPCRQIQFTEWISIKINEIWTHFRIRIICIRFKSHKNNKFLRFTVYASTHLHPRFSCLYELLLQFLFWNRIDFIAQNISIQWMTIWNLIL